MMRSLLPQYDEPLLSLCDLTFLNVVCYETKPLFISTSWHPWVVSLDLSRCFVSQCRLMLCSSVIATYVNSVYVCMYVHVETCILPPTCPESSCLPSCLPLCSSCFRGSTAPGLTLTEERAFMDPVRIFAPKHQQSILGFGVLRCSQ